MSSGCRRPVTPPNPRVSPPPNRARSQSVNSDTTPLASNSPPTPRTGTGDGPDQGSPPKGEASNVRVMVRIRPFSGQEVERAKASAGLVRSVVDAPRSDQVELLDHTKDYETKGAFCFDNVFWSVDQQESPVGYANQAAVYDQTGSVALDAAWEGMNCCIFAYGQTGSGKTHTMMGDPSKITMEVGGEGGMLEEDMGVIPRLCKQLYEDIDNRAKQTLRTGIQKMFKVQVQFIEIYNEKVRDLLVGCGACPSFVRSILGNRPRDQAGKATSLHARDSGAAADFTSETHPLVDPLDIGRKQEENELRIREHPTEGPVLEGCTVHEPRTYAEMLRLITEGNRDRSTAATKMNDRSSRSHALFRVALHQVASFEMQRVGIGGPNTHSSQRRANINLVDLAGSENVKRSGASGATMIEAQKINQSLTTLRRVIDALIDRRHHAIVPYRDSTLTWLLRTDLGGNSRCMMLATVSPHFDNAYESQRTLTYAMRARSIVNTVRVNEDDMAAMLADLERRMREAQKQMEREGISGEEHDKLQQDVEAAQAAHAELEDRIHEMQRQTEQFQKELEETRRRAAAATLKNCLVLHIAKRRHRRTAQEHAVVAEEVESMKVKLRAMGHNDVDSLVESMHTTRARVDQLRDERQRLAAGAEAAQRAAQERLEAIRQQHQQLTGQEREKHDAAAREIESMRREHADLKQRMERMQGQHEQDKQEIEAEHDRVCGALVKEMESKAKEFAEEKERWRREMEQLEDQCQRGVRQAEEKAQGRIRVLQASEGNLRGQLRRMRADHTALQQGLEEARKQLEAERTACAAELEQRRRAHGEAVARECEALGAEHARLRDSIAAAEGLAQRRAAHAQALQQYYERLESRGSEYQRQYDAIHTYLLYLRSEDPPAAWGMADVRAMFAALAGFRREYSAHRPNHEQIRLILREEADGAAGAGGSPRRGRPLSAAAAGSLCNGLFDPDTAELASNTRRLPGSARNPRSPARARSPSAGRSEASSCYSEADKVPYVSEPWHEQEERNTSFAAAAAAAMFVPYTGAIGNSSAKGRGGSTGRQRSPNRFARSSSSPPRRGGSPSSQKLSARHTARPATSRAATGGRGAHASPTRPTH
eukprot:TRINITY_DN17105_c0_g1_i3.p1 TRINITY_DN17105_c0_g1~~TRINITY_DN17105_c0_g1_i3.p1  ORF type:complete len:1142 (+),score=439.95 TRINITY_DN17105_c0_g1_i3:98-3427(+)